MAKELPYFKFYVNEWITGDITLENYYTQGVFISLCAFYWSKDCSVTMETARKRFRNDTDIITELVDLGIVKEIDGYCVINFLDEQQESKAVQKITARENGLKGGRPKKTEEKPNGLFLDNLNESEPVTETKANVNPNKTNIKESKGKERKEESPIPPADIFHHSEIVEFVNKTFDKSFTDRNLPRLNRDLINDLILAHGYSKEQVLTAWGNIVKDKFHKEKSFNIVTFNYLSETKTIERYLFWKNENHSPALVAARQTHLNSGDGIDFSTQSAK